MTKPTRDSYWTLVDEHHDNRAGQILTQTFEHTLPHGKLVHTLTLYDKRVAEAVVFVPEAIKVV